MGKHDKTANKTYNSTRPFTERPNSSYLYETQESHHANILEALRKYLDAVESILYLIFQL